MLQKVQDRTRLDLKLRHLDAYLDTQNRPAIRNPGGSSCHSWQRHREQIHCGILPSKQNTRGQISKRRQKTSTAYVHVDSALQMTMLSRYR